MPLITREFLEAGQVSRGSWDKKQFSLLGVSWPPKKEWQKSVIGTKVSKEVAEQFLAMASGTKKQRGRAHPDGMTLLLDEAAAEGAATTAQVNA